MPQCRDCGKQLPRLAFSQRQLRKHPGDRLCLACATKRVEDAKSAAKSTKASVAGGEVKTSNGSAGKSTLTSDDDDVFARMNAALDSLNMLASSATAATVMSQLGKPQTVERAMHALEHASTFREASAFLVDHVQRADDDEALLVALAKRILEVAIDQWDSPAFLVGIIELMEDLTIATRNRIPLPEAGSFDFFVDTLQRHRDDAQVVQSVASALSLNAEDPDDAATLFELGATAHLIRALHEHVESPQVCVVVIKCLEGLMRLRGSSSGKHAVLFIVVDKVVLGLSSAMLVHRQDALLQELAVNTLSWVYLEQGVIREEMAHTDVKDVDGDVVKALLAVIKWHSAHDSMVAATLSLICALSAAPRNRDIFIKQGAVNVIKSVEMRNGEPAKRALEALG